MRSGLSGIVGAMLAFLLVGEALAQSGEVRQVCREMSGKTLWLKIDVVRIQHLIGGIDATNVYPGGKVYYRAKFGGIRQIQSTSAEDFAEEARIEAATHEQGLRSKVRRWERGSQVRIHRVRAKEKEVQVDVTEDGGSKSRIRFKFDEDMALYNAETVRELFAFTFAENEADLDGADRTIKLVLGMPVADVRKLKGKPTSEVDLGRKLVLVYEDMKLIFLDGKLADVE